MTLVKLGVPRVGSDCLFVAVGEPNTAIEWSLIGPGVLSPFSNITNKAGVASAKWSSGGAVAGQTISVKVTVYA